MKQKKNGKDQRDDFLKYGVFANKDLHDATHEYRKIMERVAKKSGNYSLLESYDECFDNWVRDHGN